MKSTTTPLAKLVPITSHEIRRLFLIVALPINFWYILVWFRNIESLLEEATLWDAIGVGAYMLVFALFETAIIFILLLLVSSLVLLILKKWGEIPFFPIAHIFYLLLTSILILEQSRQFLEFPRGSIFWDMINIANNLISSSPIIILLIAFLAFVGIIIAIIRLKKFQDALEAAIDKLVLLSSLYLALNAMGVIIVLYRNLFS